MEPLLLIYNPTAGKGQLPDELAAVLDEFTNGWSPPIPPRGKGMPPGPLGNWAPGSTGWCAPEETAPSARR